VLRRIFWPGADGIRREWRKLYVNMIKSSVIDNFEIILLR
jgi:hypothetical protein